MRLHRPSGKRARGVALIEALVALLVMAFGMVAVAGLMGTLRRSADLAKQRGEALRIVQSQMEQLRDYSALNSPTPAFTNQSDFDTDIQPGLGSLTSSNNATYNATYRWQRTVDTTDPLKRPVRVAVTWKDRSDTQQTVISDSFISRSDPALAGSLGVAPAYTPLQHKPDGMTLLPPAAKNLGDGRSAMVPTPGAAVAFVFNNLTGVVTSRCTINTGTQTADLTAASLTTNCSSTNGLALWGNVNFAYATAPSSGNLVADMAASYAMPLDMSLAAASTAATVPAYECFDNSPASVALGIALPQYSVGYFCVVTPVAYQITTVTTFAVGSNTATTSYSVAGTVIFTLAPITTSTPGTVSRLPISSTTTANAWSGQLLVSGITPLSDTDPSGWKICRFTGNYDGDGVISNAEHPATYWVVQGALGNQNFLVIKGNATCPDGDPNASGTAFFSTATREQQPVIPAQATPTTTH